MITGYNEEGYEIQGPLTKKPDFMAWHMVGTSEIGVMDFGVVRRTEKPSTAVAVRDALWFAIECPQWVHDNYAAGSEGYDRWIAMLRAGEADGFGGAYNAVVWQECREMATLFLLEAEKRLGLDSRASRSALKRYLGVTAGLKQMARIFPFTVSDEEKRENVRNPEKIKKAVSVLEEVKACEEDGKRSLKSILNKLQKPISGKGLI